MNCYDIVFPLAIGPLTYHCPEALMALAQPGMLVSAPVRNRLVRGIILSKNITPPSGPLKEIAEIHGDGPVLSKHMLKLLKWMSDYYIAKEGIILKQTLAGEFFEKTKQHRSRMSTGDRDIDFQEIPRSVIQPVIDASSEKKYRTFLLHAPSSLYEYSVIPGLLETMRNVIILLPETAQADLLFSSLNKFFADRVCVLHSDMSKGRRSGYIDGIISGRYDIVVGTRMALFSPMKKVSLILLLHEHSSFYKMEDGIKYNVRDVAVMRGFLEKCPVLLSSVSPSVDSFYNAMSDKYGLIKPDALIARPRITVVDMRFCKKSSPGISKTAINIAGSRLKTGKNVMFIANRKGYATLICRECENTETCPDCKISMVMHKENLTLRCAYCGKVIDIPQKCSRCRSLKLEPIGSGTERVQEEIEKFLGRPAIRFDKDTIKKRSEMTDILKTIAESEANLLIGTKFLTTHISILHKFSLGVVLNIDASMNFPDFRATEKAFMELSSILEHIEPGGDLMIQTRNPGHFMLKCFRTDDYQSFINEELTIRRSLLFPPYSRLLGIAISGKTEIADKLIKAVRDADSSIEVLGPVMMRDRKGGAEASILLKSGDRHSLNKAVRSALGKYADLKDVRITLDVDPS